MRKILLLLLSLLIMCSCTKQKEPDPTVDPDPIVEPEKEHHDIQRIPVVNYAIENILTIEYSGDNEDVIGISGLKDKEVENKINQKIQEVYDKLNADDYIPPYKGYKAQLKQLGNYFVRDGSVYAYIYSQYNNILCLAIQGNYSFNSKDNYLTYIDTEYLNFDLRDGSIINVLDIFSDKEAGLDYINDKINESIIKNNSYDEASQEYLSVIHPLLFTKKFTSINENQKFAFAPYQNAIEIVFDYNNDEVINLKDYYGTITPSHIFIDLDGICNTIEKFKTDKQLYENNTSTKVLLNHNSLITNQVIYAGSAFALDDIEDCILGGCTYTNTNDDKLNSYVDVIGKYEKLLEQARQIRDEKKAEGLTSNDFCIEMSTSTNIDQHGEFYNISSRSFLSYYPFNTSDMEIYISESNAFCLDKNYNRLELKDIFYENVDYVSILANVMYDTLLSSVWNIEEFSVFYNEYSDDEIISLFKEFINGLDEFTLQNTHISIDSDIIRNFFEKRNVDYMVSNSYSFDTINYSNIQDYLNIFD